MSLSPIAFIAPNFRDFKNHWLKAYEPGTTTPKTMALDSTGAVTVAKLELNADGFLKSAGGALVIPYIDGTYDLWLFPTEAEADANDTSNAERVADDIEAPGSSLINDLSQAYEFPTVAAYKAFATEFPVGKVIRLLDRGAFFTVISGTGTANTFNIISSDQVSQSIDLKHKGRVNINEFGIVPNNSSIDIAPALVLMRDNPDISEVLFDDDDYYLLTDYTHATSDGTKVRLSYTGVVGKTAIKLRNGVKFEITKSNQEQLFVQGIEFYNDDANNGNVIKMIAAKVSVINNSFFDFDIALVVSRFYQLIQNNLFKGGRLGIQDDPSAGYSTNEILGNFFTGQSEGGISLVSAVAARSTNRLAGNKFEVIDAGGYAIDLRGATDSHIDTPYMESVGGITGRGIILTDCDNIQVTTPRSTPPDLTMKAVRSTVSFMGGGTISGIDATDNSKVYLYGPYETITGIVYAHDNTSFIRSYDLTENLTGNFLTPGLSRIAPGVTIVRNGAGDYTVTYDVARETNRTSVTVTAQTGANTKLRSAQVYASGASSFSVAVIDPTTGLLADPDAISYAVQDIRSTQF